MAIQFEPMPERNLIAFKVIGPFTVDDFETTWDAILRDPTFKQDVDTLWDFTDGSLAAMSFQDGQRFRAALLHRLGVRGAGHVAAVVSRDVDYGVLRMMGTIAEEVPHELAIFRSRADAEAWLAGSD